MCGLAVHKRRSRIALQQRGHCTHWLPHTPHLDKIKSDPWYLVAPSSHDFQAKCTNSLININYECWTFILEIWISFLILKWSSLSHKKMLSECSIINGSIEMVQILLVSVFSIMLKHSKPHSENFFFDETIILVNLIRTWVLPRIGKGWFKRLFSCFYIDCVTTDGANILTLNLHCASHWNRTCWLVEECFLKLADTLCQGHLYVHGS